MNRLCNILELSSLVALNYVEEHISDYGYYYDHDYCNNSCLPGFQLCLLLDSKLRDYRRVTTGLSSSRQEKMYSQHIRNLG